MVVMAYVFADYAMRLVQLDKNGHVYTALALLPDAIKP